MADPKKDELAPTNPPMAPEQQADQALQQSLGYVDSATAATTQQVGLTAHELSAIVAQHGLRGKADAERAAARIAETGQQTADRSVAAQNARTLGGLDAATEATHRAEVGQGYQRALEDHNSITDARRINQDTVNGLYDAYMQQVQAAAPLQGQRIKGELVQADTDARMTQQAKLDEEARQEQREIDREERRYQREDEKDKAKGPTETELRHESQQVKQQTIAEIQGELDNARTPADRARLQRELDEAQAMTDDEWAIAVGEQFYPDAPVHGMFSSTPTNDADARNRYVSQARNGYLRQAEQSTKLAENWDEGTEGRRQHEARAQEAADALEDDAMLAEMAIEAAVANGMTRPEAERLILGATVKEEKDVPVEETEDYIVGEGVAEALRVAGANSSELYDALLAAGVPPAVARKLRRDYAALMNDDFDRERDEDTIADLLEAE